MDAHMILVLLAVCLHFTTSDIFYGKGRFLFSYNRRSSSGTYLWGTEISYRPQNYQTYSTTQSGIVDLVKMVYAQDYTYSAAIRSKSRESFSSSDGKVMTWSTAGQYFYYMDRYDDLEIGQYISVTVEMYGRYGETIYRENYTRALASLSNCYLETPSSTRDSQLCSQYLDDDTLWVDYSATSTTRPTTTGRRSFTEDGNTRNATMYTTLSRLDAGGEGGLSEGALAAAISVPLLGIIIIIAVAIGVILLRRRILNNSGIGATQSATRGDNSGGPLGHVALAQLSTTSHKQEQYETPMQPQRVNIYESLRPYRPPPPRPSSSTQPVPVQKYSGLSYSYVGPQQDEAPRRAPPPPPAVAAIGRAHIYSSESSVAHRYDDVSCTDDGYTYPKECDS